MPRYFDSFDKIVSYIQVVAKDSFEFNSEVIKPPKRLFISKTFFRDFNCVEKCGACCPKFSLDYLNGTDRAELRLNKNSNNLEERIVKLNGKEVKIYSDMQKGNDDFFCRHLDKETGRCKIHGIHPFSCDFEIRKLLFFPSKNRALIMKKTFPRGWAMKNVRGTKGVFCKLIKSSKESINKDIELLKELDKIASLFNIETWIPKIVNLLEVNIEHIQRGRVPISKILIH